MALPVGLRAVGSFALVLCLSRLASAQQPDTAAKVYNQAAKSVLLILVRSANGQIVGQGSGFLIENGKIVTNQHVVREGSPIIDLGGARIPATVELADEADDLAILTTSAEISAEPLALADAAPTPGSAVFAIGNPLGLEKSISAGVVAGVRREGTRELLQVTTPISPGSSGGPVLDSAGKVVGVTVGTLQDGQNVNFAVPASAVAALLQGRPATQPGLASAVEAAESLMDHRGEYSQDPNSPYQRAGRQVRDDLTAAVGRATKDDVDLLLRVADEFIHPYWDAMITDAAIAAAERATQLRASPETSLALAKALDSRAIYSSDSDSSGNVFLERAEKAARHAISLAKQPSADMYLTLGEILWSRETYSEAQTALLRAYELNQKSPTLDSAWILRDLIGAAESLKHPTDVDKWFGALVQTGATDRFDWVSQAKRLYDAKRFGEAADAWQQAANALQQEVSDVHAQWADWCEAAESFVLAGGHEDSVLYDARQCIARGAGAKDSEATLAWAHQKVADVLNDRGVYEEALSQAKESTVLGPEDPWGYDSEAAALIGLRRFQEAINAAKQAVRLSDGKYGIMHFHLGYAYFETENWQFARQSYEKAAELMPREDASASNVALCYERLGSPLDAARWYEEALRRNPNRTDRQEVLNRIAALRR